MAIKTVQVKLANTAVTLPAGWNQSTATPTSTQQLFADMIDSTGASTGLSLHITAVFGGKAGSSAWATMDYHGLPMEYWRSAWYATAGGLRISGFVPGQTGNILVSGHRASTGRNSRYRTNGGTAVTYVEAATPAAPVTVPFTADASGYVILSVEVVSVFAYINGFVITYDPDIANTISSITPLVSGQSFTVVFSPTSFAATQLIASDGVITKNVSISATGTPGEFTGIAPFPADGETMLLVGDVSAKGYDGSIETAGTTVAYSISSGHPDNATAVPFTAVTITDTSDPNNIGVVHSLNPPLRVGTQIVRDAARFTTLTTGGLLSTTVDYTGVSRFYFRDPIDTLCRYWDVTTTNGVITPTNPKSLRSKLKSSLKSKLKQPLYD